MKRKTKWNQGTARCRECGSQKILANERIRTLKVCYKCSKEIIPYHIPKEQWIKYLTKHYEK